MERKPGLKVFYAKQPGKPDPRINSSGLTVHFDLFYEIYFTVLFCVRNYTV